LKRIIVNCGYRETRVAVMENKKLIDLFIETSETQRAVGNIYKAKVSDVLPGMQAAFVDIGLEKNAFLYVDDCLPAGAVDLKEKKLNIRELITQGQEILVQVTKEAVGTKGAKITTQISFPGRFLVYMPNDSYIGISRKIEKEEDRQRLHLLLTSLCEGTEGIIARTVAQEASEEEIREDFKFLKELWKKTKEKERMLKSPQVVHQDLELVSRIARDLLTEDVDEFIVDDGTRHEQVIEQLSYAIPNLEAKLKLYKGKMGVFDFYEVEGEIEKALRRKVWLKSGGYLVIDQTEALTSIDVNTGKFTGSQGLEETVFKTNQEAVGEIIRQLRLRDIGGIILVDFIDMRKPQHRDQILQEMKDGVKKEKNKAHILGFTQLGLLEMTRKRDRQTVDQVLTRPCPYCEGRGKILSEDAIVGKIEREIKEYAQGSDIEAVLLEVHPHIAEMLKSRHKAHLDYLKDSWGINVLIRSNENVHQQEYHILHLGSLEEVRARSLGKKMTT